jgi:hypothetical protein
VPQPDSTARPQALPDVVETLEPLEGRLRDLNCQPAEREQAHSVRAHTGWFCTPPLGCTDEAATVPNGGSGTSRRTGARG